MEMPKYLQKRRRRWYAAMDIPKDLRHHFNGAARLFRSLETESLTEAEVRVLRLVAEWKENFAALRNGASTKPDNVARGMYWREQLRNAENDADAKWIAETSLDDELHDVAYRDDKAANVIGMLAYSETFPLDREIEAWLNASDAQPKTKDMRRGDAVRFAQRFRLSHEVTKQKLLDWVRDLQHAASLKPATVRRILSACRGYWDYLHARGHLSGQEGVFDRVSPKKTSKGKGAAREKRQAFNAQEVVRLLSAALADESKDLGRLIWLAMWTGCRIEELCSLRVGDVKTAYFTIVDAKTSAGLRNVPIHTRLSPLLKHLCATSTDGYVLSGLTFNKYGDRSNAIGKRFGRLKTAMGFDSRYVFHSIRKTFTTELENAGIAENIAADIVGHDKQTMTYGVYSGGNRLPVLEEAISAVHFEVPPETESRLF